MKRLANHSQYFLRSPRLIKELAGHSTLKKTDTVYDIGAGSGVISSVLASRVARVVAYENDPRVAKKLRENTEKFPNVTIVEQDFLLTDLPANPYKVFANIPFHLSSPILKKLTESKNRPTAIYLVVQKQFGNKLLIDNERFTGLLGAQVAPLYTARIRKRLRKTDFWPHPAVDTVFIELLLRDESLIDERSLAKYRNFVADCYADPKIFAKMPKNESRVSLDQKPSQLTLEQWISLFRLQKIY